MTARDWLLLTEAADLAVLARGRNIRVGDIIRILAEETGKSSAAILGPRKSEGLPPIRHLAMHIAREHCPWLSTLRIGRLLNRDHTTILYGCRAAERRLESCGNYLALRGKVIRRLGLVPATVELRLVK